MSDLLDAADLYISLGLKVIALTGKAPNGAVHPHGLKDALYEGHAGLKDRHAAFTHPKTTGIGILTSYPLIVVDIDGEEGAAQYKDICRGDADLGSPSWVASTGRGLHLYYSDATARRTIKLGPKLDLKGEGGYVAAPPSAHPSGATYTWLIEPWLGDALRELPEGLEAHLTRLAFDAERRSISSAQHKRVRHEQFTDGKWWATWGFEGIYEAVREAADGNRNNVLNWASYTISEDGATQSDFDELQQAATDAGLSPAEARQTIASGRKAAQNG